MEVNNDGIIIEEGRIDKRMLVSNVSSSPYPQEHLQVQHVNQ